MEGTTTQMLIEPLEPRLVLTGGLSVTSVVNTSKMVGNENEPAIAINPTDPSNIFILSNNETFGLFSSRSADSGQTWKAKTIADGSDPLPAACCDPSVAFDDFGNLFVSYLNQSSTDKNSPGATVLYSTDNGATFHTLRQFFGDLDQPTITAGPGSVYITFARGGSLVASGASVTGLGLIGKFPAPSVIPGAAAGSFGDIAIGPSGQVAVTFERPLTTPHAGQLYISVDPDGLGPTKFSSAIPFSRTHVGGFDKIPAQDTRSIDAEVGLAYDRTGGPFNGRLYAVYTDQLSSPINNTDILLRYSDNNGARWSRPILVNDDSTSTSQFLPRISVDQSTGHIGLTWMDSRHDTATDKSGDTDNIPNDDAEAFATVGTPTPQGVGLAMNVQVSTAPSNADDSNSEVAYGDYGSAAFVNGKLVTAWADNSNSTHNNPDGHLSGFDMYFAAVTDTISSPLAASPFLTVGPLPSAKVTPLKRTIVRGSAYTFQVTYRADLVLDRSTIQPGNILVTGPNGYSQSAQLVRTLKSPNPARVTVVYSVLAPNSAWAFSDNGLYTISILDNQVTDIGSLFVPGGSLGEFTVAVKPPAV